MDLFRLITIVIIGLMISIIGASSILNYLWKCIIILNELINLQVTRVIRVITVVAVALCAFAMLITATTSPRLTPI